METDCPLPHLKRPTDCPHPGQILLDEQWTEMSSLLKKKEEETSIAQSVACHFFRTETDYMEN